MEQSTIYPVELEVRQSGGRMRIAGRFAYRATATMADRGRVRKERFEPGAFRFAVEDADRDVHLLRGHSFDQPLASKRAGSLVLEDSDDALTFEAVIPPADEQPTFMADTVRMIRAGLVGGLSPGFRVPPKDVVPDAETLEPEPGNPDVAVRVINAAVLFELSLVTRPAYPETSVDLRSFGAERPARRRRRLWL